MSTPQGTPPNGRKPKGVSWESWIDRQIRQGVADGAFDDLPGKGKPLAEFPDFHDDDWWLKAKLRAERLSYLRAGRMWCAASSPTSTARSAT